MKFRKSLRWGPLWNVAGQNIGGETRWVIKPSQVRSEKSHGQGGSRSNRDEAMEPRGASGAPIM